MNREHLRVRADFFQGCLHVQVHVCVKCTRQEADPLELKKPESEDRLEWKEGRK